MGAICKESQIFTSLLGALASPGKNSEQAVVEFLALRHRFVTVFWNQHGAVGHFGQQTSNLPGERLAQTPMLWQKPVIKLR